MTDLLYGRNAVREALRARRRSLKYLHVLAGARKTGVLAEIIELATALDLPIKHVERRTFDSQVGQSNHQGVALAASGYPYGDLQDCLECAAQRRETALLLVLDHLQDPQNVGTLLRTAEVVGAHGVILPQRRAAAITPAVVNASSGAAEHLCIAQVSNIAQAIAALQQAGMWVVGLEDDPAAQDMEQVDLNMPLALVVGAEGVGLARLSRERCDFLVRLPMRGQVESLNAAVAGSIMLYHVWRQQAKHHIV